jgi:hypothetical protein
MHLYTGGFMRWFKFVAALFLLGALSARAVVPEDIQQLLPDTANPDQSWLLTKKAVFFNPSGKKGGSWELRFDRFTFYKITGTNPDLAVNLVRIQTSKKDPGTIYLLTESQGKQRTFQASEQGKVWREVSSRATALAPPAPPPPAPEAKSSDDSIDLEELNAAPPTASGGHPHGGGAMGPAPGYIAPTFSGSGPMFKFMFDFWLYNRPGVAPLTFSNVHTLALVDVTPVPELLFAFELSPTPRFYEVTYQFTPRLSVRGGRIWIPFDTIGPQQPHNLFGGLVNVSQFRQPGGSAFLPDLWTDLGLALKYRLADSAQFRWDIEGYVVNGFQTGGTDPAGLVGTRYPNFESAGVVDNNSDKSLGFRSQMVFLGFLNLGASGYFGRYSDPTDNYRAVAMLGVDGQMRLPSGFEIKAGYLYSQIGLVPGAGADSSRRGGLYVEAGQRFLERFKFFLRGGTAQNDSRVVSVNDITMVGAGLVYNRAFLQLSLMYQRDLNQVAAKSSYEFMAGRAMVVF